MGRASKLLKLKEEQENIVHSCDTNKTPENGPCWLNGVFPNDSNLYL